MVSKHIQVCEEVCIGCHLCEVYCLTAHSRYRDVVKAHKKEAQRPLARVRVQEDGAASVAVRCLHCDDAPCVAACLTGAMHRDLATGAVLNDPDRCMGCWTCVMVCPHGAIIRDPEHHRIVKCDLCPDLEAPACVANCPNKALTLAVTP